MYEKEIAKLARSFWDTTGQKEVYPRNLEMAVAWALPLAIVKLPHLELSDVYKWLSNRGIAISCCCSACHLRAFVFAYGGRGIVFLDGTDPEDQKLFSLAHEVAHFILDYLEPRREAIALLGDEARDILDSLRGPTKEERLRGMLGGIQLGVFTHFMERTGDGILRSFEAIEAEDRADLLAIEILAPRASVVRWLKRLDVRWQNSGTATLVTRILMTEFGLPFEIADSYAQMLYLNYRSSRTFGEWLTQA